MQNPTLDNPQPFNFTRNERLYKMPDGTPCHVCDEIQKIAFATASLPPDQKPDLSGYSRADLEVMLLKAAFSMVTKDAATLLIERNMPVFKIVGATAAESVMEALVRRQPETITDAERATPNDPPKGARPEGSLILLSPVPPRSVEPEGDGGTSEAPTLAADSPGGAADFYSEPSTTGGKAR